ncbi:MAG: glycosyltransferase [Candidatus Marinimicrobia bacterium]|nr:glycosyltransferase [Candidatus Neomarinimicrobiota bacterium]
MKKLIWFAEIKWDYLVTRKQQILRRFPDDWQILYIEPYVVGKEQHWLPSRRENLTVLTIPFLKRIPNKRIAAILDLRLVRMVFGLIGTLYFQIMAMFSGFSGKDRVIGLSSAYWGKIAGRLPATLHFYDANDAHLDFPGTPEWLREYLLAYLETADLSFAVSPEIQDSIVKWGADNVQLLGNGVDYEHFSQLQTTPDELINITKPILGYAGAMDWLDAVLIVKICKAYPDYEIILLGPEIHPGWFSSQTEFTGLSNLRYLGKVDYKVLPAFVQAFNVALIPFVVDELTKPLNPNKLYEYSAAGKPVVSMNYSSTIDKLRDVIFVGNTHEEYLDQIQLALVKPEDHQRIALAKANSWDHVAQKLEDTIVAGVAGKK